MRAEEEFNEKFGNEIREMKCDRCRDTNGLFDYGGAGIFCKTCTIEVIAEDNDASADIVEREP